MLRLFLYIRCLWRGYHEFEEGESEIAYEDEDGVYVPVIKVCACGEWRWAHEDK